MDYFELNGYDESVDYARKHLQFIAEQPRLANQRLAQFNDQKCFDFHQHYYSTMRLERPHLLNKTAFINYHGDYKKLFPTKAKAAVSDATQFAHELFGNKNQNDDNVKWFVTFNFDEKKWKSDLALNCVERLMKLSFVRDFEGVFEYYGTDGNHPHLMARIETGPKVYKQTLIDKYES